MSHTRHMVTSAQARVSRLVEAANCCQCPQRHSPAWTAHQEWWAQLVMTEWLMDALD